VEPEAGASHIGRGLLCIWKGSWQGCLAGDLAPPTAFSPAHIKTTPQLEIVPAWVLVPSPVAAQASCSEIGPASEPKLALAPALEHEPS
jgi:hypothetical protein